jgi:toxin ParE1/3/4
VSKVLRRPAAETDLIEIWVYIAEKNPAAADALLESINDTCVTLATAPLMGRTRDELLPGVRSFPVGHHVIFYQPIEDGIEVVRVLHGARDFPSVIVD